MRIGGRPVGIVLAATVQRRHYKAAFNMLRVYRNPIDGFARYLFNHGRYPAVIELRTPAGGINVVVHNRRDILALNEIFCRRDYPITQDDHIVVDFGSNIGLSAAFFLSSAPASFCYLFEPLPYKVQRLHLNLRGFGNRYAVEEIAVGRADGRMEFGWEETGRYGGVGVRTGRSLSVQCRDSNTILSEIIAKHGEIDILKIDIEGLGRLVTERIPVTIARHIRRIYVEHYFRSNPLEKTHTYRQYGEVAQFESRTAF